MASSPPPRPFKKVRFAGESMVSTDYRVHFRIRPIYWFMRALGLLIDSEFNKSGYVIFEATEDGIVVTARSPLPHCSASLVCQSLDFRCFTSSPPLPPRTLYDINNIVQFLFYAPRNPSAAVTVFHAPNLFPHQLVFSYRVPPNRGMRRYCANLTLDHYYKFTRGKIFCEFPIPTTIVKEMIQHIQLAHSVHQQVTVDVKSEVVKISIGLPDKKPSALWEIKKDSSSPGIKHHALFKLPYLVFIRKAAEMSGDAVMRFSTDPEKQVILQFFLEFGELVYSFKPIELDTVPDEDPPSGNGTDSGYSAEASQSSSHAAEASQSSSDAAEASQPAGDAAEASQPAAGDAAEASQPGGGAAQASQPDAGDAAQASQPAGDAAEALQPGGDAAEASQPAGDAAQASQPAGDAAKASQPGGDAAEDFLPSGDVAWALQFVGDTPLQPGDAASETSQPSSDAAGYSSDG